MLTPRPGKAIGKADPSATQPAGGGVAVVYSFRADIHLKMGAEAFFPFDLNKGTRIYERLVADGAIGPEQVFVPAEADDAMLELVHQKPYLDSLADRAAVARILDSKVAVWQSRQDHVERIVEAYRTAVGGTVLAGELAVIHGLAIHLGGGFKHALTDRASRSSLLADVPIAVRVLRQRQRARRILIVNLGALQANGIASCLADDPDSYLLDIYEKENYPSAKQPAKGGIGIKDGLTDGDYHALLRSKLPATLEEFRPDLVFYLAGVDVVDGDAVGRTKLSLTGLLDRDLFVVGQARQRNIPLCMVLDGGGARESWRLHYRTIRGLLAIYGGVPFQAGGGP